MCVVCASVFGMRVVYNCAQVKSFNDYERMYTCGVHTTVRRARYDMFAYMCAVSKA